MILITADDLRSRDNDVGIACILVALNRLGYTDDEIADMVPAIETACMKAAYSLVPAPEALEAEMPDA